MITVCMHPKDGGSFSARLSSAGPYVVISCEGGDATLFFDSQGHANAVADAINGKAPRLPTSNAALGLAALALRAANDAEAGRAPVSRTWLRAVLADALEALAAGDDAEAVQHVITGAAELRAKREAV